MTTDQPTALRLSRRKVVGAGLAGAALALGAGGPATASTPTPPQAPTADDEALLTFAMSIELAARDLYRDAVAAGAVVGEPPLFQVIADNHDQYADVLAGQLGLAASASRDDALYDEWSSAFAAGDAAGVATVGYDLESILVATHTELLGTIEGLQAAEIIASIQVVEARHCAVLADVAGLSGDLDTVLVNTAEPLSPDAATEVSS